MKRKDPLRKLADDFLRSHNRLLHRSNRQGVKGHHMDATLTHHVALAYLNCHCRLSNLLDSLDKPKSGNHI
jgi:hypothetical protein